MQRPAKFALHLFFIQLRSLPPEARSAEIRRNPNFFPQSSKSI